MFHNVILRYDGTVLDLFLDGIKQSTSASGNFSFISFLI